MPNCDFRTTAYSVTYKTYGMTDAQGKTVYSLITKENRVQDITKERVTRSAIIGVVGESLQVGSTMKSSSKNNEDTPFGYIDAARER